MKVETYQDIQDLRFDLSTAEAHWLRRNGWKSTSSTPGCIWLWEKEWQGKTLLVEQKFAVTLQAHMAEPASPEGE